MNELGCRRQDDLIERCHRYRFKTDVQYHFFFIAKISFPSTEYVSIWKNRAATTINTLMVRYRTKSHYEYMIEGTSERQKIVQKKSEATHENWPDESIERRWKREWRWKWSEGKDDERIFFNRNHVHSFSDFIFIGKAFIFKFIIFFLVPSKNSLANIKRDRERCAKYSHCCFFFVGILC